jgi:hypothetical protein
LLRFRGLETLVSKKSQILPKNALNSLFIRYMMFCMRSIRDILREGMEECTQIRANELAILKFSDRRRQEEVGIG